MGLKDILNAFWGGLTESAKLYPGQKIALRRDFRHDVRPRTDDDDDSPEQRIAKSENRRKILSELVSVDMDRRRRLQTYEEMDKSDIAASAVDMYADDATLPNPDTGRTVWIESDSAEIQEKAEECLVNLDMEEEVSSLARQTALYGDSFERLVIEPDRGVRAYFHVHADEMKRQEDRFRVLLGYSEGQMKYEPNIHGKKLSEPYDYAHFRIRGRFRDNPYGTSILHNSIRPWRMLVLGEDQALIYRLMRAPDRFAFFVDTGTAGEVDAWQSLHRFRRRHKKLEFVDPASGRYDHRFNPITPVEDLYMAVSGKDSGTRIEKLFGSNNVNDVTDLLYYVRKFCGTVRIPPEFLGFTSMEAKSNFNVEMKSSLANQSIRYANALKKIQRAVKEGIRHTVEIHLRLMSPNVEDPTYDFTQPGKSFRVMMMPTSNLDEMDRIDAEHIRAALASSMIDLGIENPHFNLYNWTIYVLKKVFRIGDSELNKLLSKEGMERFAGKNGTLKRGQETESMAAALSQLAPQLNKLLRRSGRDDGTTLRLPENFDLRKDVEEKQERRRKSFVALTDNKK